MGNTPMPLQNTSIASSSRQADLNQTSLPPENAYIGRFAPSPTGELHFGSLVSALASFLDARHHQGTWLVRMEDIDPPREQAGAADAILRSLEAHGLNWDKSVLYQSTQTDVYESYLARLHDLNLLFACDCSRQKLQATHGVYDGFCRTRSINPNQPHALRLKVFDSDSEDSKIQFTDLIQGYQSQNLRTTAGDQILKRRDGLYAYQLAVVVDDIEQKITHIIRGSDLLEVTARQIYLFDKLNMPRATYGHVTIATHANGQKLSKQNLATPLNSNVANQNIWQALHFLGQSPPEELKFARVDELIDHARVNWKLEAIRGLSAIAAH